MILVNLFKNDFPYYFHDFICILEYGNNILHEILIKYD